jgi:DeoR family transcriptional regulator, suf operon transcriptional repressor
MSDIRQTVIETLSQEGSLPVEEIARAARVSTMAMRYHLTLLARKGLIVQQEVARRGNVGRPQMMYALADDARERLPKKYPALAAQLLDEVTDTLGEKRARAMLRRAGRHAAMAAPPLRRGAGIQARVNRATKFLTERGYMARWEKSNGDLVLSVCNCPYRQVAQEHRQVCDLDVAMIGALMGAPLKMTRCIAHHDGQCQFVVKRASNKKD